MSGILDTPRKPIEWEMVTVTGLNHIKRPFEIAAAPVWDPETLQFVTLIRYTDIDGEAI